jgi:hypothetical protein
MGRRRAALRVPSNPKQHEASAMPITAAEIESNGWVLRLTLTAAMTVPASDFAAYVFDLDGAPRVSLAMSHPGFVRSAGEAVPGPMARTIAGTLPLRLPVNPASPLLKLLDETDLGGGSIRVRLALSETVYASDTGVSLSTLAGWRTGEAAQSGLSVTNASTVAAPVPIFRWVLPSYEVTAGAFRLSLIVASHHPVGFEPVAGVRFRITDGTTVRTVWTTALATDNTYGDNLRCYTVSVDPALAPALTAGLLRCDAEVYPWLGAMRSTDPAGTRSMATLRLDGFLATAVAPFVIGYDPAGTRYSQAFAYVDPVNGTAAAAAAMVATTLAGAKAVAPAARPRTISTALQACALVNRALPAANGQASAARACDGLRIVLAPGTHAGLGTTTISTTATSTEIPVVVEGDPDDPNPRANCQLATQATGNFNMRITRIRWRNLTIRTGGAAMSASGLAYHHFDRVTAFGRAGDETVSTAPVGAIIVPGNANYAITGSRIWRTGWRIGNGSPQCGLFRANENARRANAVTIVRNRYIPVAEDGTTTGNTSEGYATWVSSLYQGALEDVFLAYNDIRHIRWPAWGYTRVPAATWGGARDRTTRHVLLNNLFERTSDSGNTSDAFWDFASAGTNLASYCIFEGNTHAGSAYSAFYNAPTQVTVADTDTAFSETRVLRVANNATDRNASKQVDFNDAITLAIRNAAGDPRGHGYRPHLVQCWDTHWGVNHEANVDCSRSGTIADDRREFFGLRGSQYVVATNPLYVDDRSEIGSNTGLGDYTPGSGSVLRGRVVRGNSDRDWANNPRLLNGAAGAIEAPVTAGGQVLAAASAVSGQGAAASVAAWATQLNSANTLMASAAMLAMLAWQGAVAPAPGLMRIETTAVALTTGSDAVVMQPFDTRLALPTAVALILPDGGVPADRTLWVRADPRMIFVNETKQEI